MRCAVASLIFALLCSAVRRHCIVSESEARIVQVLLARFGEEMIRLCGLYPGGFSFSVVYSLMFALITGFAFVALISE